MGAFEMTVGILGGLALFLFGMRVMSEGLQKVAGDRMRRILGAMTSNRFFAVLTGVVITATIQSSSATTVMLVGFVNAGLISLGQSVGVVMGANIGTTMTGWLVAIVGFKVHVAALAMPCIAVGFFIRFFGKRKLTDWGEFLLGFGVLFLGLDYMKEAVTEVRNSEALMAWIGSVSASTLLSRIFAVFVGTAVTCVVQSSSATMAITMTLAAEGMIDVHTACALILGDNIGTTITANLAAFGASAAARRTARVHTIFNVLGSVWGVALFIPFMAVVGWLVPGALEDGASKATLAAYLAAYHTMFNVTNTLLWLPFVNQLAWMATRLVSEPQQAEKPHLRYLDARLMDSPPMALHAARSEVLRMLDVTRGMLQRTNLLITHPDEKLGTVVEQVFESEQVVDNLENEIAGYLVEVVRLDTSEEQSAEIAGLLTGLHDIERIADHCESLAKMARRRYDGKLPFSQEALKDIREMGQMAESFLLLLSRNMLLPGKEVLFEARNMENAINALRKRARKGHIDRLSAGGCGVNEGLVYIDMLNSFEKIGDHAINLAEMLAGERK